MGKRLRLFLLSWNPADFRLTFLIRTIRQIRIDQGLIRKACFIGQILEILDCTLIQVNRDLLLHLTRVRVFLRVGKILFLPPCVFGHFACGA